MADHEGIEFTGRNTAEVRNWVNEDPGREQGTSWFLTRGQTTPISPQAWHYVKDGAEWPGDVVAAVYDPRTGSWSPVRKGDVIERQGSGYGVRQVTP